MIDALTNLRLEVETLPPAGKTKNLMPNPDAVRGGYFWVTPTGGTVDISQNFSGFMRYTHAAGATGFRTERMPATPGQYASARFEINGSSPVGVTVSVTFVFEDANGAVVSTTAASPAYGNSASERLYGPYLVPANTATVRAAFAVAGAGVGNYVQLGSVGVVVRAASGAVTWATDVVAAGPTWLNVLGPSIEIEVERNALDLGTLNATIRDSTLDPLVATTIRPGRLCRLSALHPTATPTRWENLFTGHITEFDVQYEADVLARKPGDPKHCKITISAADATRILAGVRRPEGVHNLLDLRDTLEDAGVPWSINGSTAHTGTPPTVVSYNENASALDQVVITRDSKQAHAWVDRRGVLQVWERAKLLPFTNTGFEVDLAGWTGAGCTRTRVTTPTYAGAGALQAVASSTAAFTVNTAQVRIIPGHVYTISIKSRAAAATARTVRLTVQYADSTGTPTGGASLGTFDATTVGAWTTHTHTIEPESIEIQQPLARNLYLSISVSAGAAGETFYFDDLQGLGVEVVHAEAGWTGIEIGGGSRQCINEVTVDYLRLVPAVGTEPAKTEVIPYGPYRNEASVGEYGVRPKRFTIQGLSETADVAAFVPLVLAANAFPKVSASAVKFPVKSASDLVPTRALGDLQQTALVSFATKGYAEPLRITGISHSIRADPQYKTRWIVEHRFESTSTVAVPRSIPTPPADHRLALTDTPWIEPTLGGGWATFGAHEPFGYRRLHGIVYMKGIIGGAGINNAFVFLPVGFRPKATAAAQIQQTVDVNGAPQTIYIRTSDGAVFFPAVAPGAAGYAVLNDIRPYPADA